MFKKTNRLNRGEFEGFFVNRKRHHSQNFQLVYTPYSTLKVAVVVPKKVVKTAVGRNRLRRQLYHRLKGLLTDKTGVFIFIVKKSILEADNKQIVKELEQLVGGITKSR